MRYLSILPIVICAYLSGYGQRVEKYQTHKSELPSIIELTQTNVIDALNLRVGSRYLKSKQSQMFYPTIKHTAFFCKIEDRMSTSVKLPVKIRLGDVNYTNKLEGKNVHDRFSLPH